MREVHPPGVRNGRQFLLRGTTRTATSRTESASEEILRDALALHVFGWRSTRDRYIKANRSWIPRWRFAPFTNLQHAFELLQAAGSSFILRSLATGAFEAEVCIGGHVGRAAGEPKARTITMAVACALRLESSVASLVSVPPHAGLGGVDGL
jgi:hypothetical protein